jgi:hypothetical protein
VNRRQRIAASANTTSITNTVIVVSVIGTSTLLVYVDKVDGAAYIGLVGAIVGAILNRQGVATGSKATADPPPE